MTKTLKCWCGADAEFLNEATDATDKHACCADHLKDGWSPLNVEVPEDVKATVTTVISESICDDLERGASALTFGEPEFEGDLGAIVFMVTKEYDDGFLDGCENPTGNYGNVTKVEFYFLLASGARTLYPRQMQDGRESHAPGLLNRSWGEWTTRDRGLTYTR